MWNFLKLNVTISVCESNLKRCQCIMRSTFNELKEKANGSKKKLGSFRQTNNNNSPERRNK